MSQADRPARSSRRRFTAAFKAAVVQEYDAADGPGARGAILTALRDHLPAIATRWHDVVMDTPPAVGMATLAALAAADVVIAPVTTEAEALDQLPRLAQVIQERIARRVRPGQSIHWVIPSRYDGRRRLDREVIAELEARYPGRVTPPVRETVIAKDAFLQGMPVSLYRPTSAVAADYAAAMALILT